MSKGRSVLIAVDGSSHSEYAFKWFAKTLYQEGDKLVALVCPQVNYRLSAVCKDDIDEQKVKKIVDDEIIRVQEAMDKFEKLIKETKIAGEVRNSGGSSPGEDILKMAKDIEASYIVIGSRGRGVNRCTTIGNVCDYVVDHSTIPVMVSKHGDWVK